MPPRPDKNLVEGQRAAKGFVELRRISLERYLQQLAAHPALASSKVRLQAAWAISVVGADHL